MKKKKNATYKIKKINGKDLVTRYLSNNTKELPIKIDISEDGIDYSLLSETTNQDDCALYYQIIKSLIDKKQTNKDSINKNSLLDYLIYFDFKNVDLAKNKNIKNIFENKEILIKTKSNGEFKPFVSFDKSGSMSRESQISFIDKEIKEYINHKLLLDLDFNNKKIEEAKMFAYKGLYLTNGIRIDLDEKFLNEESIIVLEDFTINVDNCKVITCEKVNKKSYRVIEDIEDISSKPFDGQGLIDVLLAEKISEQLNEYDNYKNSDYKATSLQIRLPFSKGVIHKVNFHQFIKKEFKYNLNEEKQKLIKDKIFIKDCFGIKRDLNKAHIILTKSMFKCATWLKDAELNDPMKYYFDKVKEYNHGLYIVQTNVQLSHSPVVPLNYQLINTLDLSEDNMKALISKHKEKIDLINKGEYDESIYQKVVKKNPAFLYDKTVSFNINNLKNSVISKLIKGHFDVEGRSCFLSGDLLALLIKILYCINDINKLDSKELIDEISKMEQIYPGNCYIPRYRNEDKKYCAVFRNPHLSRNEQCALKIFHTNKKNLIHKYFGHLSNVIMLSMASLDYLSLGGADFDGDLVKVIFDQNIIDAVLSGVYTSSENDKYIRKLSDIYIKPSRSQKKVKYKDYISYDTLVNTFDNLIGKTSNAAITIGQFQYAKNLIKNPDIELDVSCPACTIFTGLEIDAAKTGRRPKKNIRKIIDSAKKLRINGYRYLGNNYQSYTEHQNKLKNIKDIGKIKIKNIRDSSFEIESLKPNNKFNNDSTIIIKSTPATNIDYLHTEIAEFYAYKNNKYSPDNDRVYFAFEKDEFYKVKLNKSKLNKVKNIMHLWKDSIDLKKIESNRNYDYIDSEIYKILENQYPNNLIIGKNNDENDVYEVVLNIFNHLDSKFDSNALVRIKYDLKYDWLDANKTEKIKILKKELKMDNNDNNSPMVELLTNSKNKGSNLLNLFIKSSIDRKEKRYSANIKVDKMKDKLSKNENYKAIKDSLEYSIKFKENKTSFRNEATFICRNLLERLFDNPQKDYNDSQDEMLKYVFAASKNNEFLWEVINKDTILRNIYEV